MKKKQNYKRWSIIQSTNQTSWAVVVTSVIVNANKNKGSIVILLAQVEGVKNKIWVLS